MRRGRVCMPVTMRGVFRRRLEKFLRVFFKFRQAVLAAEIISLIVVNVTARRIVGLHVHPADRISHVDSSSMSATIPLRYYSDPSSAKILLFGLKLILVDLAARVSLTQDLYRRIQLLLFAFA